MPRANIAGIQSMRFIGNSSSLGRSNKPQRSAHEAIIEIRFGVRILCTSRRKGSLPARSRLCPPRRDGSPPGPIVVGSSTSRRYPTPPSVEKMRGWVRSVSRSTSRDEWASGTTAEQRSAAPHWNEAERAPAISRTGTRTSCGADGLRMDRIEVMGAPARSGMETAPVGASP